MFGGFFKKSKKKKEYWIGSHSILQGIFLTQRSNPHLLRPALAVGFFTASATWEALRLQ